MADEFDTQKKWIDKLIQLRNQVAYIPYAAEHTRDDAVPIYNEIEEAYQNGNLPPDIEDLWEQHKQTLLDITQRVDQFVQDWQDDFSPPFGKRPPE